MSTNTSQRSFMDAINERYGAEDDSNSYSEDAFDVGSTRSAKKNNKKWEMVGMDMARQKQSNHSKLSVLGLQDCNISYAEKAPSQIVNAGLKRVRELNLSDNNNLSAVEIDKIISALPSLVELQLSGTGIGNVSCWSPLASQQDLTSNTNNTSSSNNVVLNNNNSSEDFSVGTPTTPSGAAASSLSQQQRPSSPFIHNNWTRLTTLALNRCNMNWENLLEAFPCNLVSLVSLHLESNGITKIYPPTIRRTPSQQHAVVTSTTTANEPTASSASSSFLPLFPALKELNLSFNELTTLDQDEEMIKFFEIDTPKLTSLNLTGNKIALSTKKKNNAGDNEETNNTTSCNYLSRLEVLYLTQNPTLVSANYSSNDVVVDSSSSSSTTSSISEEPLAALEWIRVQCPKVKSLRVTYQDVFGEPATPSLSTTSQNRPKSSLSEVQQRSLVIAAISQLETLNSGPVRAKERLDAEMSYLQVAKAKKEQQQQQQENSSSKASSSIMSLSSSATNRFFPWKQFPLLDFLAEKHKNVILTSLSGNNSIQNGDGKERKITADNSTFFKAIMTVIIADVSMSLDNVLGVAGAAKQHYILLVFGLILSILLMATVANIISKWIKTYRWIGWLGLIAILAVAIELIYSDIATFL